MGYKNYEGDVQPLSLVPLHGNSYMEISELSEILNLANTWQYLDMGKKLIELRESPSIDQKIKDLSLMLETEVALDIGLNEKALSLLERFLTNNPNDIQALFLSACVSYNLSDTDSFEAFAKRLKAQSEHFSNELHRILNLLQENQRRTDFGISDEEISQLDAVVLYGHRMEEDGSMSEPLKTRLMEVERILKMNPNTILLASGGATLTPFSEADAMWEWLDEHGIDRSRIYMDENAKNTIGNNFGYQSLIDEHELKYLNFCVVTSMFHLPRAWMSFTESMKSFNRSYKNIYASAYEPAGSIEIPDSEIIFGLFTVFHSARLFERKDFVY